MALGALKSITCRSSRPPPPLLVSVRGFVSRLFVGGLSFHTTEKTLAEAFSRYGQVIEAKIIMDRALEKSKGFGFVTFGSQDEAEKSIEEMSGKVLDGRVISVDVAKANQGSDESSGVVARGPPGYEGSSSKSNLKAKSTFSRKKEKQKEISSDLP